MTNNNIKETIIAVIFALLMAIAFILTLVYEGDKGLIDLL